MVVAMTTSSCRDRQPLPQQGWGFGGGGRRGGARGGVCCKFLAASELTPSSEREEASGDAAAPAASTADALVRLEGWFLLTPSPTRERGNKIPAAAADVGFGGCIRLGHKENGFSLHLSLLSTASPGLIMVSRRLWSYLLGLAAG